MLTLLFYYFIKSRPHLLKRLKFTLFILFIFSILGTQCSTAVKHVAKRTITAPYEVLKNTWSALTPDQYQKIVREEEQLRAQRSKVVNVLKPDCENGKSQAQDKATQLGKDVSTIEGSICKTCKPWARTESPSPFCSSKCPQACKLICPPKGLGILDLYKKRCIPSDDHKLAFRNNDAMFKDASGIIPFQGYCSGMVSSRRKFNMHAFFSKEEKPKREDGTVINPQTNPEEYISYYKTIIDRIHNNYPTEIPGYENLGEFTQDPLIQDIMRQTIADEWADKTILRSTANSTAFYDAALGRDEMNIEKSQELIKELEAKVSQVGSATLYMGFGGVMNMHIVDAYKVIRTPQSETTLAKLCLNDPNYSGSWHKNSNTNCSPSADVFKDGSMKYSTPYSTETITQAQIDHPQDEDSAVTSIKRLRSYCKSKRSPPCKT